MTSLSARDAYRRWAPDYESETAISYLENQIVATLRLPSANRRLLDAGCGTRRRLRTSRAALAVGVDLTPEMLVSSPGGGVVAAGDLRALPLASETFDIVWCRLAIGHLRELDLAYAELARVARPGGAVVVTDFHPDAVAAGHRRTFRDGAGVVQEIEHYVHTPEEHLAAASASHLDLIARRDGKVGAIVRPFYARAGRLTTYAEQRGVRIVLALAYRRPA
jgi:malonyl-CoA O-methyltransferase